ncbi:MAG: PD40 domain-containing protein [Gemmatimonadetes bacterium]|nr:PD40 domain-containing protein [Gemmatimonadota bacterium]
MTRRAVPAFLLCLATATLAAAQPGGVRIGLTYAPGVKPGVVVGLASGPLGDSATAILARDLDFGDRVTVLAGAMAVAPAGAGAKGPNYALLAKLGAAAYVQLDWAGARLRATVYDVGGARVLDTLSVALPTPPQTRPWRAALHRLADDVERVLTGTPGIARTRIAYVKGGRTWLVDSDGAFPEAASEGSALSPDWRPDGGALAWTTLTNAGSRVQVKDLGSGRVSALASTSEGLNITPAFTPDGANIVYAHGGENGTDLWIAPVAGGEARRITVGRGSDNTSPTLSPDGRRVAFTSGRAGKPDLYVADLDGTNTDALTDLGLDEESYRAGPDWSADGRAIAFATRLRGQFQVAVLSLRDRAVKVLTSDGKNEDPSWAPDGRHLVFTSNRTGTQELWVVDAESGRVRQLTHERGARLAAWSPRLPATP